MPAHSVDERAIGWSRTGVWTPFDATASNLPVPIMRMPQMKSRMIVSDIVSTLDRIQVLCHKNGVNVLYGDSSAKWVPREFIKDQLAAVSRSLWQVT